MIYQNFWDRFVLISDIFKLDIEKLLNEIVESKAGVYSNCVTVPYIKKDKKNILKK